MFKRRLRELRLENKLNQPELADKLNVAKQTVSNWENGNRTPDNDMLIKIADFFDVSIDYLLGRTDDPEAIIYKTELNGNDIEVAISKNYPYDLTPDQVRKMIDRLQDIGFDVEKFIKKTKEGK